MDAKNEMLTSTEDGVEEVFKDGNVKEYVTSQSSCLCSHFVVSIGFVIKIKRLYS